MCKTKKGDSNINRLDIDDKRINFKIAVKTIQNKTQRKKENN